MKWKLHTRPNSPFEIHEPGFTEAICEHGIGHHNGLHSCDGCCGRKDCPRDKVTTEER